MIVGLRHAWKFPIGYFFVHGVDGKLLSSLIKEAIDRLFECGIMVCSTTCDGTAHNLTALSLLGSCCSIKGTPLFSHPKDNSLVCTFLDPPHMLKLIRNSWEALGTIVWPGKGRAEWRFIKSLVNFQAHHGLRLANKLTEAHVYFKEQKMKVYLASQVFSRSVANSLRWLHSQNQSGFTDDSVLSTAAFCEFINDLFDFFNCKRYYSKNSLVPRISKNTRQLWIPFLEVSQEALKSFEMIGGQKLINSRKKTGFLGFHQNCVALKHLADRLFHHGDFDFLLTYKLCQDFLEFFFRCY